jgi:hypothetical protein
MVTNILLFLPSQEWVQLRPSGTTLNSLQLITKVYLRVLGVGFGLVRFWFWYKKYRK